MYRRIHDLVDLPANQELLEEICMQKGLNDYETEIILRIYWQKQKLTDISERMDFMGHGKDRHTYSTRTISKYHKEAISKILGKEL